MDTITTTDQSPETADTITRTELKDWLMAELHTDDSIKRTYIQIAQEVAKQLIQQKFGNIDPLPRAAVKAIVQECVEMCAGHYQQTLRDMEKVR